MTLTLVSEVAALRERIADARRTGGRVGLVPTMGALHLGHAELIERARLDCDTTVVTIFVNPLQFDRADDLQRYPRTLDADVELCDRMGVDLVFAPSPVEMYPTPPDCMVDVGHLADHLCGPFRPGHFQGVATVVMKLFAIAQPDAAYFGEKDAQQLAIIRRMVADLNVPVQIVGVATVREPDGLAMSSRNRHLTPTERQSALALFRALQTADRAISTGITDADAVGRLARETIPRDDASLRLEYLEIVDPDSMQPIEKITGPVRVAGALWVGRTRLIDNVLSEPGG